MLAAPGRLHTPFDWEHNHRGDRARWFDRSIEGDAYVTFSGETPEVIDRMDMQAVDSRSDFDFTDMQLMRVVED